MFALDLFNTRYERRLAEGAVDQLEQRRIDDLAMRMDDLVARARTAHTPEAKAALVKEFQKCKAERDSYFKIKDECMGYGSLGEADQVPAPTQPVRAGTDLVTPQQRVAGATSPSNTALGKAKETFTSFANWLAGKDDVGPTYESTVEKQTSAISPVTAAKYAYEQMRKAHDDNVDIATIRWMNNPEVITMSRNQLYHTLIRLKNMSRQNRNQFALQTLADRNNFALWLGGQKKIQTRPQLKATTDPFQTELPLGKPKPVTPVQERVQKKNSDDPKFGDAETANALRKIRAKHPATSSDLEALAKDELDHQARSDQQLAAIKGANTKQDELLKQLVSLDQEQGREIDGLDSENNSLEAQLARIQATNDRLQTTIQSMTGTKQSARPKQTAKAEPQTKTTEPTLAPVIAVDPAVEKKIQDLEAQLSKLEKQPQSADVKKQIADLENRINALPAKAAKALNINQDDSTVAKKQYQGPRVQAPLGDLDIQPPKSKVKVKPKTPATPPKANAPKATPVPNPEDEFDLLNIDESANKLHAGDPVVVTAPNEFEGKTGEIYDFAPSRKFVIVDLYNHGKHSMHLSDVAYNQYADDQEQDDWYDDQEVNEGSMSEIDVMRQDLELMSDRQFKVAYGLSKVAFRQKYRALLNPAPEQDTPVEEGWSDAIVAQRTGQPRTPYSVYIKGKKWRDFENDDHAEAVANKLRAKFKADGRDPSVITIAPTDYDKKSVNELDATTLKSYADKRGAQVAAMKADNPDAPAGSPEWIKQAVPAQQVNLAKRKIARKERQQGVAETPTDYQKRRQREREVDAGRPVKPVPKNPQTDYARKRAKDRKDMELGEMHETQKYIVTINGKATSPLYADMADRLYIAAKRAQPNAQIEKAPAPTAQRQKGIDRVKAGYGDEDALDLHEQLPSTPPANRKEYLDQRDKLFRMLAVDANPVNKQIIKQALKDLDARYGSAKDPIREESSTSSDAVERAILNRIMVAHTDLLMKFGPEKVMQAAEEVAYNVGDVDEIGTSDVSAYVNQVKQILGAE